MSTFNLSKKTEGQSIFNLSKGDIAEVSNNLKKIAIGAGWDPVQSGQDIDLDLSILFPEGPNLYYKHLPRYSGYSAEEVEKMFPGFEHSGDDVTGEGGDSGIPDEVVSINLDEVKYDSFIISINSFSGQSFGDVKQAFATIDDATSGMPYDIDPRTNKKIFHKRNRIADFNLSKDGGDKKSIFVGKFEKINGIWKFVTLDVYSRLSKIPEISSTFRENNLFGVAPEQFEKFVAGSSQNKGFFGGIFS